MNTLRSIFSNRLFLFSTAIIVGIVVGYAFKSDDETVVSSEGEVKAVKASVNDDTTNERSFVVETDDRNNKVASGHYLGEDRTGRWDFFHSNGKLKASGDFQSGNRVGSWRFYFPNEELMSEGHYDADGLRDGYWISFYASGQRKSEGEYASDVKSGLWTAWPYEGHEKYYWKGSFDEDGKKDGVWSWYAEDVMRIKENWSHGELQSKQTYGKGSLVPPNATGITNATQIRIE